MSNIITQGSFPRMLQAGINKIAGESYKDYEPEEKAIFKHLTTSKAYELNLMTSPTGMAARIPEGHAVTYSSAKQDWPTVYQPDIYGLGGIITFQAMMNNQYWDVMQKLGKMLKRSLIHTDEQLGANFIINGYDSNFPIGDGQPLFSLSHVFGKGGTFANRFSVATPFSQAALEDAYIAVEDFRDGANLLIQAKVKSLHGPRQLRFEFERVLKSTKEPGSPNNDVNTMQNALPFFINHRFTSASEWFVKTDIEEGFKKYTRMNYTFMTDNDFGTSNYRHKGLLWVAYGTDDARCAWGNGQ